MSRPLLDIQAVRLVRGADLERFCAERDDASKARAKSLVRKHLGRRWLARLLPEKKPGGVLLNAQTEDERVDAQILKLTRAASLEARKLTEQMNAGEITVEEWYYAMMENLRALYLAIGLIAQDGDDDDDGAGAILAGLMVSQFQYLNRLAEGLADGTIAKDGRAVIRAGGYAASGYGIYQQARRYHQMKAGYTMERRVLGAAEHCPDCVTYAARGWQPIGTLPSIGDSQCVYNCHCHFEYGERFTLGA